MADELTRPDEDWKVLQDVAELVRAAEAARMELHTTDLWWRGHSDCKWHLVPGAKREGRDHRYEKNTVNRFRQGARTRHDACPDPDDFSGWLFLMQHYRLPTRLLDWTESPLIAAYFAVEDSKQRDQDSCIWALSPYRLNQAILGVDATVPPTSKLVRLMFESPFAEEPRAEAGVAAVVTDEIDIRMTVQLSNFTVHGTNVPLEEHPEADSFLLKLQIPAEAKRNFRRQLSVLGIRLSNLFPDLEHLAKEVSALRFPDLGDS